MKEKWKFDNWGWDILMAVAAVTLLCFLIFFVFGCGEQKADRTTTTPSQDTSITYYCPMHPEVVQNKPGKCPKPECMGMDLMIKMADTLLEKVLKPVNQSVLASIKTTKPVFQNVPLVVNANGFIDFDTREMNNVSSLYSGRIEKLYVKYAYQEVKKGQRLFDVYSPELVSAQQNLLYILNNDPNEKTLIESAKQKLVLLGFPNKLLNEVISTKTVITTVPVYSKYEGHIHPVEMQNPGMNSMGKVPKENIQANKELSIKEGMYVMMGQTLFNLVNSNKLAVILQIRTEDIAKVHKGMKMEMMMEENGMTMSGKIDFVDPFFKEGAKTMTARVYIENLPASKVGTGYNHKVGSLVKAKIEGEDFESLWIPVTALVDLGKEKIVWKLENGNFIAKKVETGLFENGMVEIADGLTETSEIALEAHYLIDSEGFIKTNDEE